MKALYVGWEKSEPSDFDKEQNETANLVMVNKNNICFMAHENKVISNCDDLTLEELEDAYCDLKNDYKLLSKKYSILKKSKHVVTLRRVAQAQRWVHC